MKQLMIEINIFSTFIMKLQMPNRKGKYSPCAEIKIFHNSLSHRDTQAMRLNFILAELRKFGYQLEKKIAVLVKY